MALIGNLLYFRTTRARNCVRPTCARVIEPGQMALLAHPLVNWAQREGVRVTLASRAEPVLCPRCAREALAMFGVRVASPATRVAG